MKLPLAYYGDPILRVKCSQVKEINDDIRQLVNDMIETLEEYKGAGLAAPQVHRDLALFMTFAPVRDPENPEKWLKPRLRVFINPKIISYSKDESVWGQGCLSIPKIFGDVRRPFTIVVTATDLDGNSFTEEFSDYEAQAVMHENDHINGVLFIDRLEMRERKKLEPQLRELKKKYDLIRKSEAKK
jgi:peptide deformylase